MTAKTKVVLLDQSQIGIILKHGGVASLDAIAGRGDKFLFVRNAFHQENLAQLSAEQKIVFDRWLEKQRYASKIVEIKGAGDIKERRFFDPLGKAGTSGNNQELWDMGARKFMLENQDLYEFEAISHDKDFLENRLGREHPVSKVAFERVSLKSAMTWLLVHPDVDLSESQFESIRERVRAGQFGKSNKLERNPPSLPESYRHSQDLKVTNRFNKLVRRGASVAVLGLGVVPIFSMVEARAEEKDISFLQAADELGLNFSEEQLRGLAAEVGVDLAVSFTPVGWVKKGWEILGNFDDIVAVTRLYGAAYPDNAAIQELAGIAETVERSSTFKTYVEGRDALVGGVGDLIDGVFSAADSEEELGRSLGAVRAALETADQDAEAALQGGATRAEVEAVFDSALSDNVLDPGVSSSALSGGQGAETEPRGGAGRPMSGSETPLFNKESTTPSPVLPGVPLRDHMPPETSYDRLRRFGPDPEAGARASEEFDRLLRDSLIDMGGDRQAADLLAAHRFRQGWGATEFDPAALGTVIKYPVEKVYPEQDGRGHEYVREQIKARLAQQGKAGGAWALTPNEKTGRDWRQGWTDTRGYGPRMTLAYDDDLGQRHVVSEVFQARVADPGQQAGPAGQTVGAPLPRQAASGPAHD